MSKRIFTLIVATVIVASSAQTALAASAEWTILSKINADRRARGLPALTMDSELQRVARNHSAKMANQGRLSHNPNLGSQVSGWRRLGENVAVATTTSGVHRVIMGSSEHRANVLDPGFNGVGVGIVSKGGRLWTTEVFVYRNGGKLYPASGSAPSPPKKASSSSGAKPAANPSPKPSPVSPPTPLTAIVATDEAPIEVLASEFSKEPEEVGWPGWVPYAPIGLLLAMAAAGGLIRARKTSGPPH